MDNQHLIDLAASVVHSAKLGDNTSGDVGAAVLSVSGNTYTGVCIDTSSGMGFCAEHSAIAEMIKAHEYEIRKVVAVWKDASGVVFVIPPCGRCREFMRQINIKNLDADVVLDKNKTVKLRELLPYHDWWKKQE